MNDEDMITIKLTVDSFLNLIGCLEGYELSLQERLEILSELDKYIDEVY